MRGAVLVAAVTAALAAGCGSGQCRSPEESGPGAAGSLTYVDGAGRSIRAMLEGQPDVTNDALELDGVFTDVDGRERGYRLLVDGLRAGATIDLAGHGQICFPRQTGGADVCSDLEGSIAVRTISADCTGTQGVSFCADSIDATIIAKSPWQGTSVAIDATFSETGRWTDTQCTAD